MKDFKMGISDANDGVIEGIITGDPVMVSSEGKLTINFTLSSERYTGTGKKCFQYGLVIFSPYSEAVKAFIADGKFVRCNYHLLSAGDYCRPVVDFMQIDKDEDGC
jgi:hypothetical protein